MAEDIVIDRKFNITAVHATKGTINTEKNGMFFKAADPFLPTLLEVYISEMVKAGVGKRQIESVSLLLKRVVNYQVTHPELVKKPDVDTGDEADRCLAPNES